MIFKRLLGGQAPDRRSYSEDVARAMAAAATESGADAGRLAAARFCSQLVGRTLAGADLTADQVVGDLFPPDVRALIGSELVLSGEAVFDLATGNGLSLRVAEISDVADGPIYDLTLPQPSGQTTARREPNAILLFRWMIDPNRPWRGLGPLIAARSTTDLAAVIEKKLYGEIERIKPKMILPTPLSSADLTALRNDLGNKDGGTLTPPTMQSGFGAGAANAPRQEYQAIRLGARPPEELIDLRLAAARDVLVSCGFSPALIAPDDGPAAREAWRQALHGVLQPLADSVAAEIATKLERDVKLRVADSAFGDVQGRARGFRNLTQGGIEAGQAAEWTGFT